MVPYCPSSMDRSLMVTLPSKLMSPVLVAGGGGGGVTELTVTDALALAEPPELLQVNV